MTANNWRPWLCSLQALGDAVELGAPLTTRQVCLLLAARPGGDRVTRAGRRGSAEPSV